MRYLLFCFLLTLLSCASFKERFRSALPQSEVRVKNLGAVQLTSSPKAEHHRIMKHRPWQWRGRRALGAPMQSFVPPIFLGGDDVLIVTLGGGIGVYNVVSGAPRWFHEIDVGAASYPHIVDSFVYVAGMDQYVRKMRLDNGEEVWKVRMSAESTGALSSSLGFVYVSLDDASLVALDEKTGQLQWAYKRPAPSGVAHWSLRGSGNPLVNSQGDRVYIGFSDGVYVALEASSGQTLWERNFARAGLFQDADQRAVMSADGTSIYLPLVDGDLVVLKTVDGSTLFAVSAGGGATPLVDESAGVFYAVLNTGAVQKYDIKTSKLLWTSELASGHLSAPVAVTSNYVAVMSANDGLKIIHQAEGKLVFEYRVGPGALSPVSFDGARLLVLSARNRLLRFRVEERMTTNQTTANFFRESSISNNLIIVDGNGLAF